MRKGSLTVFFSMLLLSMMSLLFSMAECVHLYALGRTCEHLSETAIESSFSEYNPYLWEKYKILAVDAAGGFEARNYDFQMNNVSENESLIEPYPVDVWLGNYQLLTDANAAGLIGQGADCALRDLPADLLEEVSRDLQSLEGTEEIDVDELVNQAESDLADAKENRKTSSSEGEPAGSRPGNNEQVPKDYDDPLTTYSDLKDMMSAGVLSQVVEDVNSLSNEVINSSSRVSARSLATGNAVDLSQVDLKTKLLYIQYLTENFSYYGQNISHEGLVYEAEYVINGQESDRENLAKTVEKLLLLREAENYAAILSDPEKMSEALAMATAIGGVSLNPAVVESLKYAIVGVWAYIESVLDVRLLLAGGRVAIVKSNAEWTSDVWHLASVVDVSFMAKECQMGLTYKDYLRLMLTAESEEELGLRSCDVLENALQTQEDYCDTKLDDMIVAAQLYTKYQAKQIFFSVIPVSGATMESYEITKKASLAY